MQANVPAVLGSQVCRSQVCLCLPLVKKKELFSETVTLKKISLPSGVIPTAVRYFSFLPKACMQSLHARLSGLTSNCALQYSRYGIRVYKAEERGAWTAMTSTYRFVLAVGTCRNQRAPLWEKRNQERQPAGAQDIAESLLGVTKTAFVPAGPSLPHERGCKLESSAHFRDAHTESWTCPRPERAQHHTGPTPGFYLGS